MNMNFNNGEVLILNDKNYVIVNRLKLSGKDIVVISEENSDDKKYLLIGEDQSLQEITYNNLINSINEQMINSIDDVKSIIDEAMYNIDEY